MRKNKITALLPMKANSERVKGKNFKSFNGKPLFRWTLDTLMSIDEIDQIIINTDARKILSDNGLVESTRIVIRDRKTDICGDLVSMNDVIQDDVMNIDSEIFLMTHTTNPLITKKTVQGALTAFRKNKNVESLFTVDKIQTRFYDIDCKPINHNPNNLLRTQDLPPWFEENSNLYIFTRDSFLESKARIGKHTMMYETPKFESIDIDTPEDWDLAVAISGHMQDGVEC